MKCLARLRLPRAGSHQSQLLYKNVRLYTTNPTPKNDPVVREDEQYTFDPYRMDWTPEEYARIFRESPSKPSEAVSNGQPTPPTPEDQISSEPPMHLTLEIKREEVDGNRKNIAIGKERTERTRLSDQRKQAARALQQASRDRDLKPVDGKRVRIRRILGETEAEAELKSRRVKTDPVMGTILKIGMDTAVIRREMSGEPLPDEKLEVGEPREEIAKHPILKIRKYMQPLIKKFVSRLTWESPNESPERDEERDPSARDQEASQDKAVVIRKHISGKGSNKLNPKLEIQSAPQIPQLPVRTLPSGENSDAQTPQSQPILERNEDPDPGDPEPPPLIRKYTALSRGDSQKEKIKRKVPKMRIRKYDAKLRLQTPDPDSPREKARRLTFEGRGILVGGEGDGKVEPDV